MPDVNRPLDVVIGVLGAFDWDGLGREAQRQRHAIIAANPELHERDLMKRDAIAVAFADALRERGVAAATAQLAARVGAQVFFTAYEHWLAAGEETSLTTTLEASRRRFAALVAGPGVEPGSPPV